MMRKTLTLLTLALLLATCFAFAAPVNNNAAMANTTAITCVPATNQADMVVNGEVIDNPATVAGTEKNEVTITTTTNAAAMIPANKAPAPEVAFNVIKPNQKVANGAGTALTKTMAPAIMKA